MLKNSLLDDVQNNPVLQPYKHCSEDWDEIKWWSDQMYMPYTVEPIGQGLKPQSSMHSVQVGSMIVTRFKYGIPVHIYDWDQAAGNILLLTTLEGRGSHAVNHSHWQTTRIGESFLADCSRNDDYAIKFDPDHLQLNLTIPHQVIANLILQNFGHEAPDRLWKCKTFFGGEGSSWLGLLRYLMQSIAEIPKVQLTHRAGEYLQQMMGLHILDDIAGGGELEQEMGYQLQTNMRYQLTEQIDLRAGLSYADFGKTELNSVKTHRHIQSKFWLGTAIKPTATTQLIASYSQDIDVENGFKENHRLNLRFLKVF